jgi:hypothetical protein
LDWPCGQNPGRQPEGAPTRYVARGDEPRRTEFDLQGQVALAFERPADQPRRCGKLVAACLPPGRLDGRQERRRQAAGPDVGPARVLLAA